MITIEEGTSLSLQGIPSAQGIGIGQGWVVESLSFNESFQSVCDIPTEQERFLQALEHTRLDLIQLVHNCELSFLLEAYLLILDSPSLKQNTLEWIEKGLNASNALGKVIEQYRLSFAQIKDTHLKERACELIEVGHRVIKYLENKSPIFKKDWPENLILILDNLSTSALFEIPRSHIKGIISAQGSYHSHVAIVARSMGIPTVLGVNLSSSLQQYHLKPILVNGDTAQVYLSPSQSILSRFSCISHFALASKKIEPGLDVYINAHAGVDIKKALDLGVKGIGLYRTEMDFMKYSQFPTEEDQYSIYRKLLTKAAPYPVNIRIVDIGGDKQLPYFLSTHEANPALGLRGIRVMLKHPLIFLTQLRAMLKASEGLHNLQILLPMITSFSELEQAKALIHQAYTEVVKEYPEIVFPLIGAMIEVPSAIFQIEAITQQVDFISIGTNDLTQYLLAVDRTNHEVSSLYDSLHPAVLRAVNQIIVAVHAQGKKVSVCGEMVNNPLGLRVLKGLKVDSISIDSQYLPRINTLSQLTDLEIANVLQMNTVEEMRAYLER